MSGKMPSLDNPHVANIWQPGLNFPWAIIPTHVHKMKVKDVGKNFLFFLGKHQAQLLQNPNTASDGKVYSLRC